VINIVEKNKMETFTIKDDKINVEEIMEKIRQSIQKKKKTHYTDEDIQEIAKKKLATFLHTSEVKSNFTEELHRLKENWNVSISLESIYKSHPNLKGSIIYWIRKRLRPIARLFFNIDVLFPEFHKQSKINLSYAHLLHNLIFELTKLKLEHEELRKINENLIRQLQMEEKRERTLEKVVLEKAAESTKETKKAAQRKTKKSAE
jgi:hypothetical protein